MDQRLYLLAWPGRIAWERTCLAILGNQNTFLGTL